MDGWIRIGTDVDTKTFDAEIEQCERELEELKAQIENPDTIQIDTSEFDRKIASTEKQINELKSNFGDNPSIISSSALEKLENDLAELNAAKIEFIQNEKTKFLETAEVKAEKLGNKLIDLEAKKNKIMLDNKGTFLDGIASGTQNILGQIAKWGLAVFGVRSAYRAVASAISLVSQYNEQVGTDIQYIRYALAMTLAPVIQSIISLVYKALALIALLIKNLTGIDIFKNSGVDKFQAGMKSGVASSKKIKENLNTAKFDEITKLSNTTNDAGAGGGGGGVGTPSLDLSQANSEVEQFYEDCKNKWEKLGEDLQYALDNPELFDEVFGDWSDLVYGMAWMAKGAYDIADGFFEAIGGVIKIVTGIFTDDMDLVGEGFRMLGEGLWNIVKGLLELILGAIAMVLGGIWDFCKLTIKAIGEAISTVWNAIKDVLKWIGNKLLDAIKWVYDSFIKPVGKFFSDLWTSIMNIFINVGKWFGDRFSEARDKVKTAFSSIVDFVRNIWSSIVSIFSDIGSRIGDAIGGAFRGAINGAISVVENLINRVVSGINRALELINKIPGVQLSPISRVNLPRMAMASGGIVNLPGRGVPIGNAITGEAGAEGVLPLTNENVMSELGERIGKYVNLTINLTSKLDNRVLARETIKANQQSDFIRNR